MNMEEVAIALREEVENKISLLEVIYDFRNDCWAYHEIAEIVGINTVQVRHFVIKYFPELSRVNLGKRDKPLSDRTKQIIAMRRDKKTYQEIGDAFGVTRERVRQVLEKTAPDITGPMSEPNPCVQCGEQMRGGRQHVRCYKCHEPYEKYVRYKNFINENTSLYEEIIKEHKSKQSYHLDDRGWGGLTKRFFPDHPRKSYAHYFCRLYEARKTYMDKYEAAS